MQQPVYLCSLTQSPARWRTIWNSWRIQCRSAGKSSSGWRMKRGTNTKNGIWKVFTLRHCAHSVRYQHLITSTEVGSILIFLLQTRKRRPREVKYLAWGHRAEPRLKPGQHDPVLGKLLIVAALESKGQRVIAQEWFKPIKMLGSPCPKWAKTGKSVGGREEKRQPNRVF